MAALYLVAYRARIESGDALMLFDAVSSWVDHGDFRLDLAAAQRPPPLVGDFDLVRHDIEPLPVWLASPLYALAKFVPAIGIVHSVYLFNVIVTALCGGVLYVIARQIGSGRRTAALGALSCGVATILLPYAQSFFREPLMTLCLLLSAWGVIHARTADRGALIGWIVGIMGGIGAFLTKSSAVLALPALAILAVPSLHLTRRQWRGVGIAALVALMSGGVFVALSALGVITGRYDVLQRLDAASGGYLGVALSAYLLSPGGSIWGTSPILLLALPGVWIAARERSWRVPLAAGGMLAAFAVGYAVLSESHWFGGLSAPPRFLIPVVPFIILAALPTLDRILDSRRAAVWIVFVALCAYSVWWQLTTASYWWGVYPEQLPPAANGLVEWAGGLYDPRYWRPVVLSSLWATWTLDLAWVTIRQPAWGIAFAGFACLGLVGLARGWRRSAWIAVMILIVLTGGYLVALHAADDRYDARNTPLHDLLPIIEAETTANDVILLASPRYQNFFGNAYRGAAGVVTLPEQPGEQPSPEGAAFVRSANPAMLLTPQTIPLIHRLASERERLWLVVEFSPELAWSVRPVERFMAAHYYPIRQFQTSPTTRLIEFSTAFAPDPYGFWNADRVTDLVYGGVMNLRGAALPHGTVYTAGDALPISLQWTVSAPSDARYTVALYLRDANGAPVVQNDWQPGFNFAPTDTWTPNLPVWDNRAFDLPADLPSGDYQLWVKVYEFVDGSARDLPVTGAQTMDGVIGVLPVTIRVE